MSLRSIHAFDDELARLDATATAEKIRTGELTSAEVVTAAIARAERLEPELNAIVTADFERARQLAVRWSAGAFAGVPTFIKDLIDVAGLPTRMGCEGLSEAGPKAKSSPIAQQFLDMGMICLGKSQMPEFGLTSSAEFPTWKPTRNPWNLDHSTGGSSSGAAALVAAGIVPIAHTADGGGSTRLPAACCGLVGLKPTLARLLPSPAEKVLPLRVVVDGVVSRTVRDTALYYAEAEKQYCNPRLPRLGHVTEPLRRRLRVGAAIQLPVGGPIDEATRRTFEETVALLEGLGHTVRPVTIPVTGELRDDFRRYFGFLGFLLTRGGRLLFDRSFDFNRLTPYNIGLSAVFRREFLQLPAGVRRLRHARMLYASMFEQIDVLLTPVSTTVAPPIGHLSVTEPFDVMFPRLADWIGITPVANVSGAPALSLPLGHDPATNLPVGMMFGAARGNDRLLLELALELEQARPFGHLDASLTHRSAA